MLCKKHLTSYFMKKHNNSVALYPIHLLYKIGKFVCFQLVAAWWKFCMAQDTVRMGDGNSYITFPDKELIEVFCPS